MYIAQTEELLEAIYTAHRDNKVSYRFTTLIHGAAGIGKTQLQKFLATKLGMALINVRVGQLEPGDLIGIPYNVRVNKVNIMEYSIPNYLPQYKYDEHGEPVLRKDRSHALDIERMGDIVQNRKELLEMFDGDLNEVKGAVIFLDEINRIAGDDTKQAIFQLPEQYRIHTYRVPDSCVLVAAANPSTNEYQVSDIDGDKAFMDRFMHIKMRARVEDWMAWAMGRGIHPDLISFYNEMPDALLAEEKSFNLNIHPSPRSAELIHTLLTEVDLPTDDSIRREVFMGILGDKYGPLLCNHLRENLGKVLTGSDIIEKYQVGGDKGLRKLIKNAIKEKRVDYIDQVNRNVYSYLRNVENWETLESDDNIENLEEYLKDLSSEQRMTLVQQLIKIKIGTRELNDILGQSDLIYETLKSDSSRSDGLK